MADQIDVERGERMKEIREMRQETQPDFAARLNAAARELGLSIDYDFQEVSKRETARRRLGPEDFIAVAMLDPKRRGWTWVAFGKAVKIGRDAWAIVAGQQPKRDSGAG